MGIIYNPPKQKKLRQHLRNNATDAERILWSSLKNSQLSGYKFRRQQGIGKYIVDFYCPAKKVAIEIDGETHWTDKELDHDKARQQEIENLGVRVLRFTNEDIYKNRDNVLDLIVNILEGHKDE
jgi:very-short-patch-repair endonuclease